MTDSLQLAVALDGAGWHPAAWREPSARPLELTSASYWRDLVLAAERAGIDFVTIEDSFSLQSSRFAAPDDRLDQVRGRLDALLIAAFVAPSTSRIGLVPTVTTTHTEPFHVATALQTLDHVSGGRGGWRAQVSAASSEAALFGRRAIPPLDLDAYRRGEGEALVRELFDEAGDVVEVVRRLWDSWEDDAVIRDVATGRYLDASKLHGAEFEGRFFSVTGASITPRSPGQPPVTVLAHATIPYELAAQHADIVYVTPQSTEHLAEILTELDAVQARLRPPQLPPLLVYADLLVLLDDDARQAELALQRLDEWAGSPLESDALVIAGTPAALVERLLDWQARGLDGVRLRPARLPADLDAIAEGVVPVLRAAGVRGADGADTAPESLREALGLARPENRYHRGGAASAPPAPAPAGAEVATAEVTA